MSRRSFLVGGSALAGSALLLAGGAYIAGDGDVRLDPLLKGDRDQTMAAPDGVTRHWLGPDLWGNRLQDWRRHEGRIECLTGAKGEELRTVALLTREVIAGDRPGHLRVRAGIAGGPEDNGFCGILLGVGGDTLDYRGAALVQRGSGTGGGMLCTFGTDGRIRFREHTDETRPLAFAIQPAETDVAPDGPHRPTRGDAIQLALDILPRGEGRFDIQLKALDPESGRALAAGVRRDIPGSAVRGGLALVSSPPPHEPGTRWWFEGLETGGPNVATYPDRKLGPILGTLFSLDGETLKLTAQLFPVGNPDERLVRFEYRPPSRVAADGTENRDGENWQAGGQSPVEDGYVARFRHDDWDATRAWEYRIVYEGVHTWTYEGQIPREPTNGEDLTIVLFSCTKPTARPLEGERASATLPGMTPPGRYTPRNIYFPHAGAVENTEAHEPDMLVFAGDQLYEENPTRRDEDPDPELDYLYKWYLWLWAFRDLTRDRPSLVLVDDHDVYQANIWGMSGRPTPGGHAGNGGYRKTPEFVNRIQRLQCGHNPDPADDRPVERGIDVYYTAFEYGGVRFALLEDRKFKSPPPTARTNPPQLLSERQLSFLREWARTGAEETPHICLPQTVFACPNTTPEGDPMRDYDSNGYPNPARDRAIRALREAGALMLSGDQHLGTLLRHGLGTHTDGVVQFSVPQTGATFQRWFEPGELPNDAGTPHTGNFTDAFGNRFRMLAVANPEISFERFRRHRPTGQGLPERDLRSDGYGIVRVDHDADTFVVECWPWDADPTTADNQYDGWPYRLPFQATDGRR